MDIKTVQAALELQAEFNAKLTKSLEQLRSGKTLGLEAAVEEKRRQLIRAGASIEALEKERSDTLSRLDRSLEQSKADLAQLETELKQLESRLDGTDRGGTRPGRRPRKKGASSKNRS